MCVGDRSYHAFNIVWGINVRETQCREPMFLQAPIASPVVFRIMRIAVAELRVRQVAPDTDFTFRRVAAHFPRSFKELSFGYHCPTPTPPVKARGLFGHHPSFSITASETS